MSDIDAFFENAAYKLRTLLRHRVVAFSNHEPSATAGTCSKKCILVTANQLHFLDSDAFSEDAAYDVAGRC